MKQETARARCRKLAICRIRRPKRGKSGSNYLERSQLIKSLANVLDAKLALR
ncbi:hypothetical protein [Enterobacter vonholyi]|uniref:hypothetical protein n=1 Tax=Enterobacter vonholyi TaxID=2797505 RepID=UPI002DB63C63|nr:hypothetical protein [Enterobacter vonholyi]MEB5981765.1 hypothetical protein [Enterobacter vonholyi]